jgi:hypothetical protein
MKMRNRLVLLAAFAFAALSGCGTDPHSNGSTLDLETVPTLSSFHVGDTSGFWIVSKTEVLATGRSQTTDNYPTFHLVSSDTTVVGILQDGRRITALKEGSAEVKALDNKSDLVSQTSVKVTVLPAP